MRSRTRLGPLAALALVFMLAGGPALAEGPGKRTPVAAQSGLDQERANKQAVREANDRDGARVSASGPTTRGAVVRLGTRDVALPDDAELGGLIVSVSCDPGVKCPEGMLYRILRGRSHAFVRVSDGMVIEKAVSPGEEHAFDFLDGPQATDGIAPMSLAGRYIYLGDDPYYSISGQYNHANYWWALNASSTWWWAESGIESTITSAVSTWSSQLTRQTWTKVSSESSGDVKFKVLPSYCPANSNGCAGVESWVHDASRGSRYAQNWLIAFTSATPTAGTAKHEIGHLYGLADRYGTQAECDSGEESIMEGSSCHGDVTSLDVSRAREAYESGYLHTLSASTTPGPGGRLIVQLSWKDDAVAEYEHRIGVYVLTGGSYVLSKTLTQYTGIGRTDAQTITRTYDRLGEGTPQGTYKFCVQAYHKMSNTTGAQQCVTGIIVP